MPEENDLEMPEGLIGVGLKIYGSFKSIFFQVPFEDREVFFPPIGKKHQVEKPRPIPPMLNGLAAWDFTTFPSIYVTHDPAKKKVSKKPPEAMALDDFLETGLCDFNYSYSEGRAEPEKKHDGSTSDFIDSFLSDKPLKPTSQTFIVQGKIGCGKSTFLASLHRDLSRRSGPLKTSVFRIDARLDLKPVLDRIASDEEIPTGMIDDLLESAVTRTLRSRIGGSFRGDPSASISEMFSAVHAQGKSPVLLIDELDYVYYLFCKFEIGAGGLRHQEVYQKFNVVFKYFLNFSVKYGTSSALSNTIIFVALRNTTADLIQDIGAFGFEKAPSNIAHLPHIIDLEIINNLRLKNIIGKRLEYLMQIIKNNNLPNSHQVLERFREASQRIKSDDVDYTKNIVLSVHGIRHIMGTLAKTRSVDDSFELLTTYILQPNLMRIYQYLDGVPHYSQTLEGVSNIFLVNSSFARKQNIKPPYQPRLLKKHLQTAWLKYFLVSFVVQQSKENEFCSYEDICRIFCNPEDRNGWRFYERELVDLVLLHATEVQHGRLVKLLSKKKDSCQIVHSTRAKEFIEKNYYWQFSYLFVTIEDEWLNVPKPLESEFCIREDWQRSFHFVTKYASLTDDERYRFVEYKTKIVLIYLTYLSVSLDEERQRYADTFVRLQPYFPEIMDSTLFRKMGDRTEESILEFTGKYVGESYIPRIKELIGDYKANSLEQHRKTLKRHFMRYYYGSIAPVSFVSMNKKMKLYYTDFSYIRDN